MVWKHGHTDAHTERLPGRYHGTGRSDPLAAWPGHTVYLYYILMLLALFIHGAGKLSIDHLMSKKLKL
jgi:uncharacterized membrane protein YphA (DoxX/SURF4 family)